jgi:hypothetical protein
MIPSNKITLKVVRGPTENQEFIFTQETVHIGSSYAQNDLIMNVKGISARHARIWQEKHQFYVQNLSDNLFSISDGTSLAQNETCELISGSEMDLGTIKLQLSNGTEKNSTIQQIGERILKKAGDSQLGRYLRFSEYPNLFKIGGFAIGLFVISVITVAGLYNMQNSKKSDTSYPAASSEEPIALPAKGKYGYIKNNDKSHPDKAVFTFQTDASNVELYYSAGGIDSEQEVSISLNGQFIGYAPLSKGGWGKETAVRLPKEALKKKGNNRLVFDSMENPPNLNQWAVKNIEIKELALNLCDVEKARKMIDLGKEMYEQKTISKGNLYMAYRYYSDAVSYLQDCGNDIDMLRQAKLKQNSSMQELDALYTSLKFAFKKAFKMNDYSQCKSILENMVLHIPDKSDERHKQAAEKLDEYNRYFQMQKK